MRNSTDLRRGRLGLLIAALVLGTASAASAMPAPREALAPGWEAFLGCWESITPPAITVADTVRPHLVCVIPVAGSSAVDMVTVVDGKVVERERVDATATPTRVERDGCAGTRSATWSTVGQRLYVRSDLTCEGGLRRVSSGVISMATTGAGQSAFNVGHEWTDVQAVAVGEQRAVRVLRYREARPSTVTPPEITAALGVRPFSVSAARLAATAPITTADIVDVSRHLDAAGVEVWLLEQKLAFTADAKRIVELTQSGVPGGVVDVVVALSYPKRFTIDANQREIALRPGEPREGESFGRRRGYGFDPMFDPTWDPYYYGRRYYSPYGYSPYGYGYGYGAGYGWYPGQRPVVIVVTDPKPSQPREEGRAVNGRGYTRSRPATNPTPDRSGSGSGSGSSGGSSSAGSSEGSSSGGSSSGGSSSGGSSSGSTGRTAKVRPPGSTL
jgi:hypothetical protein